MRLNEEQEAFVSAIRDFCQRECGTSEQREKLTSGYTELHNDDIYRQMAELGWLGLTIPEQHGGSGGTLPHTGDSTSLPLAKVGLGLLAAGGVIYSIAVKRRKALSVSR